MMYQYEVALSFAGENRSFAEGVATALRAEGVQVFYDDFYTADLWGTDLPNKLRQVYYADSRYCIMVLTDHYIQKMWTMYERQQAIERLIQQKGDAYILPVRLDGFRDDVPGLSNAIGYLSVKSTEPHRVVDNFLAKISKSRTKESLPMAAQPSRTHIPHLKKPFTDREKNRFFKDAFEQIVSHIERFANDTHTAQPHFEHEMERITSRKVLFTLYSNDAELTRFKLWCGDGSFGFGDQSICIAHGTRLSVDSDSSMHESLLLEEREGELTLKPMGIAMFGRDRNSYLSPVEAAEYIWEMVCRTIQPMR